MITISNTIFALRATRSAHILSNHKQKNGDAWLAFARTAFATTQKSAMRLRYDFLSSNISPVVSGYCFSTGIKPLDVSAI